MQVQNSLFFCHYFFNEMARYKKIRYRRFRKSNYMVQRRLVETGDWTQSGVDPQHWNSAAVIFGLDDDDIMNTDHGSAIRTVKHITVDIAKRPWFKFPTNIDGHFIYSYPGLVWACVYVPQGTQPNPLFAGANNTNMVLYEPNQFVLGAGVIPDGGYDYVNEQVQGEEATFDARPNAGNATRLRVPLSRKMNPGDKLITSITTSIKGSLLTLNWLIDVIIATLRNNTSTKHNLIRFRKHHISIISTSKHETR